MVKSSQLALSRAIVWSFLVAVLPGCASAPPLASHAGNHELSSSLHLPGGPRDPDAERCEERRTDRGTVVQTCAVVAQVGPMVHVEVVQTERTPDGWPVVVRFSQLYAGDSLAGGVPEYGVWELTRDPTDARRATAHSLVTGRVIELDVVDDDHFRFRDE